LSPGAQGVTAAGDERFVRRPAVAPVHQLHVHRGDVGVPGSLRVDEELLDYTGQKLNACLPLSRSDEAEPLILSSTAVALWSFDDR
jgi:hypothetical protein